MCVSEIRVKWIRVNQGHGVHAMLKKVFSLRIKKTFLINLPFPIDLVDLNWREFLLLQNYSTSYANEEKKIQSQRNSFISVLQ